MQNAMNAEPGRVLAGRYCLGGVLGTGGMSTVYRAWDLQLGRAVAIKLYTSNADALARQRFRDEARTLAALSHPGLVAVYDAGTDRDQRYLVLQLIPGQNLRERLSKEPLRPRQVRELGVGLAKALAYVHGQGVIHRDVKPANVLLDHISRPHLADFGISRLVNATRVTAAGIFVGTPAYFAPEQVLGTEVCAAADIYAFGLVLLECLTGRTEYPGTEIEAAVARLHRAPSPPRGAPADLVALLMAMTERNPARRPTAADCVEMLEHGESKPAVEVIRAPLPAVLGAGRKRSARLAVAASMVVIGAAGWTLVSTAQPSGSTPAEPAISGVPLAPASTASRTPGTPAAVVLTAIVTAPGSNAQPLDVQSPDVQPSDVQSSDIQPSDIQPPDTRSPGAQPPDVQPPDAQAPGVQPPEISSSEDGPPDDQRGNGNGRGRKGG